MPLRSVEAATRDDAIAAAREQFGPTARVVGVRRVRSGGVLGFFATERYVAEVASDATGRPVVPASRAADAPHDDVPPSDFSSPLASATPARARAAAPARNGAAAWAAEAARASRDLPPSAPVRATTPAPVDAWPVASPKASAPARTAAPRADQDRVSELAGLLAPQAAAPEPPAYPRGRYPRAEFERTGSPRAQVQSPARIDDDIDGGAGFGLPAASASAGPSPFTAALARMVSGDRDVRQAVREALDDPAAPRPRSLGDSWQTRPGALGPADTSVAPPAARQKEETVGDQVIAPSSFVDQPVEIPAWAAAPKVTPSTSPREEAIAEVLRAALAQGHSDEALAGILRKVLAGVSPQTALAEPEAAVPVRSVPVVEAPAPVPAPIPAPVVEAPAPVPAPIPAPVAESVPVVSAPSLPALDTLDTTPDAPVPPVVEVVAAPPAVPPVTAPPAPALFPAAPVPSQPGPAPLFSAPASYFVAPAPFALPPLFAASAGSMWGDPSPATLWGDPVTVAYSRTRSSDAPIWDEITQQETSGTDLELGTESAVVAEDVFAAGDELAAAEQMVDEQAPDEDTAAELTAVEYAAFEDVPLDTLEADAPENAIAAAAEEATAAEIAAEAAAEAEAAEAAAAEIAAAEAAAAEAEAAAAEAEAAEAEAEAAEAEIAAAEAEIAAAAAEAAAAAAEAAAAEAAAAAEIAAAEAAAAEAAMTESFSEPLAGTTLAEQVEEALAELSADEGVMEFLAEADAEAAGTEATAEGSETEAAIVAEIATETAAAPDIEELAPLMARTASDPAPMMSLDATTVMPPLSLLPPLPSSRGRGRPPVPPASRSLTPRASAAVATPPSTVEQPDRGIDSEGPAVPVTRSWATVTRLPVGPLMATTGMPDMPELDVDGSGDLADALFAEPQPQAALQPEARQEHPLPRETPAVPAQITSRDLPSRLEALGLPGDLLGDTFTDDVANQGTYAALTRALGRRLPAPPELPSGAGEVLFVVGPGVETLRAARNLAASLRLDRDSVQWATRGELAGLAPKGSRMTTVETAMDRRQDAAASGNVTIVAVDAPLRSDAYWMSQMLAIWTPTAVWVVVEATRKPEDLEPWLDGLPRVDALVVTDTDLSADPAAVLRRVAAPVAIVDGVRATPHRWASLLCERLESTTA